MHYNPFLQFDFFEIFIITSFDFENDQEERDEKVLYG